MSGKVDLRFYLSVKLWKPAFLYFLYARWVLYKKNDTNSNDWMMLYKPHVHTGLLCTIHLEMASK